MEKVVQSGIGGTRELSGDELKKALESSQFNMLYRTAELGYKVVAKEKRCSKADPSMLLSWSKH